MVARAQATDGGQGLERSFGVGLARAFGGALLFALPMLMTMEMWELGSTMARGRLLLLVLALLPLLYGLAHFMGFEEADAFRQAAVDALVAFAVGVLSSALFLFLFGLLTPQMCASEWVGRIALQAVPGSIGALLAQAQLGQGRGEEGRKRRQAGPAGEYFYLAAGALFLSLNMAPTEEMVLITYRMGPGRVLALALLSVAVMHAWVYALEFRGQEQMPEGTPRGGALWRYTVPGYAISLLISAYVLWTFGSFDGMSFADMLQSSVVLGFPASVGAAAARLIL
ncbi:TIGR02587 family membrane protein [Aggregicoccus sp. 17bor-14]|nr:TIGR02587 family membrane protein [Simulacricoccus sp. 17bor-14]MRI92217.1 TIGR02587 family membrane protein [Aggregicoccus sp. 17bor-14]